jgi:hypothetical protein
MLRHVGLVRTDVSEELNASFIRVTRISELGTMLVKFVPHLLHNEQKQHRLEVCRELQQQLQEDLNVLWEVVSGGENWVYGYNPET